MKNNLGINSKKNIFDKLMFGFALIIFGTAMYWILRLAPFDRATGDDFAWGWRTHRALVEGAGFTGLIGAIRETIAYFYQNWQGTWFTGVLFSLQPEVFSKDAYFLTPVIMSFLYIVSLLMLLKTVLKETLGLNKTQMITITMLFFLACSQFVPASQSMFYWWNGCAHYMVPLSMAQLLTALVIKYLRTYRIKYLVLISVLSTLLGGGNYQAALLALFSIFVLGLCKLILTGIKELKVYLLLLPVVLEGIGLIISMKAPGNKVRGGEDFGFSFERVKDTLIQSVIDAYSWGKEYTIHKPLALVLMLTIFILLYMFFSATISKRGKIIAAKANAEEVNTAKANAEEVNTAKANAEEVNFAKANAEEVNIAKTNATEVNFTKANAEEINITKANSEEVYATKTNDEKINTNKIGTDKTSDKSMVSDGGKINESARKIVLYVLGMLALAALYILMRTPETYAGVTVSLGTYNTNYLVLYLSILGIEILLSQLLSELCPVKDILYIPLGIAAALILVIGMARYGIEDTLSYGAREYIYKGAAEQFREDMDYIDSLLDSENRYVIVPALSEDQGPLRHMPYGEDTNGWPNHEACLFYDKDCITTLE